MFAAAPQAAGHHQADPLELAELLARAVRHVRVPVHVRCVVQLETQTNRRIFSLFYSGE